MRHITVSWTKVAGAVHYRVLVRPLGGDVIIDRTTDATSIAAVLAPGTYQVRVISFNLFQKPASQSDWRLLDVVQVFMPVVDRFAPSVLYSGYSENSFALDGAKFIDETEVSLLRGGKQVALAVNDQVGDKRLLTRFDLTSVPPGTYDLRVANPENLVLNLPGAVEVRPRVQPGIGSISIHHGYNDRVYRRVLVEGDGFEPGTSFFLQGAGGRIDIPLATVQSPFEAYLDINLAEARPGAYDVVVANPGGLSATLSRALAVDNIEAPQFVSMTPSVFTEGRSDGTFTLRAKALVADTQVFFGRNGNLVPALERNGAKTRGAPIAQDVEQTRSYQIDLRSVAPGTYDLIIANSQALQTVVAGLITVNPEPVTTIQGTSLKRGYNTIEYKNVVLTGENFLSSYKVVLRRGTVIHELATRYVSPEELQYDADLRGFVPGNYELLVESAARVVASLPGGVVVEEPPQRFVHPQTIKITAGYPYIYALSQSFASVITGSVAGGDVVAALPLGVKFFPTTPGLRDLGVEIEIDYSVYTDVGASSNAALDLGELGTNLYYRTPFNFPLNGILRVGYGLSYSSFNLTAGGQTESGTSEDFYFKAGSSIELDIGKTITVETGADWIRVLYANANLDSLSLFVRVGARLGRLGP